MIPVKAFVLGVIMGAAQGLATQAPRIESVEYSGDGCPPGTARVAISPDGEAFTVVFDDFIAILDPAAPGRDRKEQCAVQIVMAAMPGQQFTITHVDFDGFAELGEKAWGMQHAKYRFKGGQFMKPSHMRLMGPYSNTYLRRDESGDFPRGWSRCGEAVVFEIDTRMQVGGNGEGFLSVDIVDGATHPTRQTYHVAMQDCR